MNIPESVTQTIAVIQTNLKITDWKISVSYGETGNSLAQIIPNPKAKTAWLTLPYTFDESDTSTLYHELLHIVVAEWSFAVRNFIITLDHFELDRLQAISDYFEERTVEHLAKVLNDCKFE